MPTVELTWAWLSLARLVRHLGVALVVVAASAALCCIADNVECPDLEALTAALCGVAAGVLPATLTVHCSRSKTQPIRSFAYSYIHATYWWAALVSWQRC